MCAHKPQKINNCLGSNTQVKIFWIRCHVRHSSPLFAPGRININFKLLYLTKVTKDT